MMENRKFTTEELQNIVVDLVILTKKQFKAKYRQNDESLSMRISLTSPYTISDANSLSNPELNNQIIVTNALDANESLRDKSFQMIIDKLPELNLVKYLEFTFNHYPADIIFDDFIKGCQEGFFPDMLKIFFLNPIEFIIPAPAFDPATLSQLLQAFSCQARNNFVDAIYLYGQHIDHTGINALSEFIGKESSKGIIHVWAHLKMDDVNANNCIKTLMEALDKSRTSKHLCMDFIGLNNFDISLETVRMIANTFMSNTSVLKFDTKFISNDYNNEIQQQISIINACMERNYFLFYYPEHADFILEACRRANLYTDNSSSKNVPLLKVLSAYKLFEINRDQTDQFPFKLKEYLNKLKRIAESIQERMGPDNHKKLT